MLERVFMCVFGYAMLRYDCGLGYHYYAGRILSCINIFYYPRSVTRDYRIVRDEFTHIYVGRISIVF